MMINSSSFESPKPYLFMHYLICSVQALLRYLILAQSNPISIVSIYRGLQIKCYHCTIGKTFLLNVSFQSHLLESEIISCRQCCWEKKKILAASGKKDCSNGGGWRKWRQKKVFCCNEMALLL